MTPHLSLENTSEPSDAALTIDATDIVLHRWRLRFDGCACDVSIGVNQTNIVPAIYVDQNRFVLCAVEQAVFVLDAQNGILVSSIADLTHAGPIEALDGTDFVILGAEDEILIFAKDGSLRNRFGLPDVLMDFRLEAGRLMVELMDDSIVHFDLSAN